LIDHQWEGYERGGTREKEKGGGMSEEVWEAGEKWQSGVVA
jgi:hypothetical protein